MDKFWVIVYDVITSDFKAVREASIASKTYTNRDDAEKALLEISMRDTGSDYYLLEAVACVSFPTDTRPTYVVEEIC